MSLVEEFISFLDEIGIESIRHPEDCKRIAGLAARHGHFLNLVDAQAIWEHYSESECAGWIRLPSSDKELEAILYGDA